MHRPDAPPRLRPASAAGCSASLRWLFVLLALALAGLCPALPALAGESARPLALACPDDMPPYGFRDEAGRAAGLVPDIWRLVAASTGQPLDLRPMPSAEALRELLQGKVDAVAGLAPETASPADAERLALTRPVLDLGIGVFAPAGETARLGDEPLLVGLVGNDAAASFLAASFPNLRQRAYPDLDALAAALALGQVRVAAGPRLALWRRLVALGGPERFALLRSFPGQPLRAALRIDDQGLLARLNSGLEALGPAEVRALEERYAATGKALPAWLGGAAAGTAGLCAGLLLWLRARRARTQAEARNRETDLLRDNLMGEMARHRKTQDLLLAAIEQSPSGIIIAYADKSLAPVYNSRALGILGVSLPPPGRLPYDPAWRIFSSTGRLLTHQDLPMRTALLRGEVLENVEHRLVLASGEERWILTNAAPVRDAKGEILAGVVVFHDITATRQNERDLARFKFFLEAGVEEVYLLKPSGNLAYANEAVARSLGYARQELHDIPLADIDPAFSPEGVYRLLTAVRRGPQTFTTTQRTRQGKALLKELKAFYMRFGEEEYVCAFGQDVTERHRLERELTSTRALFAASLEQAPWGILVGDAASYRVSIANPAAAALLGMEQRQLVGMDVNEPLPGGPDPEGEGQEPESGGTPLARAMLWGESTRDLELRHAPEGGPERWLLANAAPVRGTDGAILAGIQVMTDITARKLMEQQLVFKAMHDGLTGLPNRALCLDLLGEALERARGEGRTLAVGFVDLDRFKMLNDSLGHSFGDRVLVQAARRLSAALEGVGGVSRFGGDEFVLLVEGAADADEAQARIAEAVTSLCRPMRVDGQEVRLTVSVGVVLGPTEDSPTPEKVLQNADLAMHRAKDTGRDRVRVFHPGMLRRAQELLSLDADMRRGLERGEFLVFYQPIVSADGSDILGLEALARWRSPVRGLVPPHTFISHAEESGLIVPLGRQVLRQACAAMTAWRARFPSARRVSLSVNLSARQFNQADLVEDVRQVLRETGLPPALFKLELTESAIMGDPEAALSSMRRLKALGLSLAIDDFGTGYSSLAYLQRFPVDVLKIDRAFVRDLPRTDADSLALVRAIAALAGSLRLGMVAEGVETVEQLEVLVGLGCQAMQGFLFHPPLPEEAVTRLLEQAEAEAGEAGDRG